MPNSNQKTYTIGTRGSLLALTQCNQIKDVLEEVTGDKFILDVIKTQGDMDTSKPLWQMEGKDFFTKELDEALLCGQVDLVVHSYKDLGSERPDGITLAAITERNYAHDILLIKNETIEKLDSLDEIIVGTSSPRRIANIEKSLADFLPTKERKSVKTKMLRGNVNTRIQKLQDDNYHAIVLALPGIERLALTESSRLELEKLTEGLNFMILPQTIFPSAASQGALGIEYNSKREDNGELFDKLKKVECKRTVSEVSRERHAFQNYGGGCHLAVGINVKKVGENYLHIHKGAVDHKEINDMLLESVSETCHDKSSAFIGMPKGKLDWSSEKFLFDSLITKELLEVADTSTEKDLYVTSTYCIEAAKKINANVVWSSGIRTMKSLAKEGIWVNGSSDSLGDQELKNLKKSKAIEVILGKNSEVEVLTNNESTSTIGNTTACYKRIVGNLSEQEIDKLSQTKVFYWTSFYQYEQYTKICPSIKQAFHCCGLGKTLTRFSEANINVKPFTNFKEFKNWIEG